MWEVWLHDYVIVDDKGRNMSLINAHFPSLRDALARVKEAMDEQKEFRRTKLASLSMEIPDKKKALTKDEHLHSKLRKINMPTATLLEPGNI